MNISNCKKNNMGTVSFDGKFAGMRKAQDFIVYPLTEATTSIKIQSDTRIGTINLESGDVHMSPPKPGGAYFHDLCHATSVGVLTAEELFLLKANIFATASGKAGTNGVIFCDNSAAIEVFT